MVGEWEIVFDLSLLNPAGAVTSTLRFNETDDDTSWHFKLVPSECSTGLPVRATEDDIPQGDGQIPHRRWRSGYGVHLGIELLVDSGGELTAACDSDLVGMIDLLGLHLNDMIRTGLVSGLPNARLLWTPTGYAGRMFDRLQLNAPGPTLNVLEGDLGPRVVVDFDTPYPYYIAQTQTVTMIGGTSSEIITNEGNTDSFLVAQVDGPTGVFRITNTSVTDLEGNALELRYDDALPGAETIGGSDFVEIVFFTGTAYLNGDEGNRKAGIDFRETEFFPLAPGDNLIEVVGANATILSNSAWA